MIDPLLDGRIDGSSLQPYEVQPMHGLRQHVVLQWLHAAQRWPDAVLSQMPTTFLRFLQHCAPVDLTAVRLACSAASRSQLLAATAESCRSVQVMFVPVQQSLLTMNTHSASQAVALTRWERTSNLPGSDEVCCYAHNAGCLAVSPAGCTRLSCTAGCWDTLRHSCGRPRSRTAKEGMHPHLRASFACWHQRS